MDALCCSTAVATRSMPPTHTRDGDWIGSWTQCICLRCGVMVETEGRYTMRQED